MGQTLTIVLSDGTFDSIRRHAAAVGVSPAQVAATSLEQRFGGRDADPRPTEAEAQTAREQFERHFGAVDLGRPTGADNEGINADLAREFAETHEDT